MSSLWKKLNKLNKSNYEISKETNIPEEKVEEIMRGERPVPTEMVDDFRKALNKDNKAEKSIKMIEVMNWYNSADLRKEREDMGYKTQKSMALASGLGQSTICSLETKNREYSDNIMIKYYDFLHNDLNRVIKPVKKYTTSPDRIPSPNGTRNKSLETTISDEELENWYNNFDFNQFLRRRGWHYKDLATAIGYKSGSTVGEAIRLVRGFERHKKTLLKLYEYIMENDKEIENPITMIETTPQEIAPLIEETYNKPLNFYTGEEEDIEVLEEPTYEANVVEPIEDKPYVYSAEQIMISKKEYEEPIKTSNDIRVLEELNEDKKGTIMRLEQELADAKKQIARYEKLIDMIGL